MNLLTQTKSLLATSALITFSLIITGCGGGGGSSKPENPPIASSLAASNSSSNLATSSSSNSSTSSAAIVSTTYNVRVHVPESFPSNDHTGKSTNVQLGANNMALVSVSLSGVVTERYNIKAADITKNDDSNWTIKAQVAPRADTVVVADVTKSIDLSAINTIKTDGLVYAPITSDTVNISVASTSAYKALLAELGGSGTFSDQGINPAASTTLASVQSLVNTVQAAVTDEYLSNTTTLSAALAAADEPAKAVVKQEVTAIKNPVAGSAVSLIRDEGGLFWYDSEAGEITSRALVGTDNETYKVYADNAFVTKPAPNDDHAIVLSSSGWVPSNNVNKVVSYNDDGSVTTHNTTSYNIGETFNVSQVFDLSGRNILDYLQSTTNTAGMTSIVDPAAVFASGSKGYRLQEKVPSIIYSVFYEPGDAQGKCWGGSHLASESGGNCLSLDFTLADNTIKHAETGYNNMFSTAAEVDKTGYKAVIIGSVGPNKLEAQIINDATKTVKFYEHSYGPTVFSKLIATTTWDEITLPYLTLDNKAVHFKIPESVFDVGDVWLGSSRDAYLAQQNGYLRNLFNGMPNASEAVHFNATASASINSAATSYKNPLVGTWNADSEYFIFSNNNTFTHVKTSTDDPNCQAGLATGSYSWNPATSILSVVLHADTTAKDPSDSCSVRKTIKLSLNGNKFLLATDEGDYTFNKSTSSTGLVGTWIYGDASDYGVLLFTSNQYFISDYNVTDDYGSENGTYVYNTGTNQLTPTVINDKNGDKGFSDSNNQPMPIVIAPDGNSFTTEDGFVLTRLE